MDDHMGRITIIASSTMVHQRARCMICGQPVDHRVVFMTNDARVLHAGCIPDHVKVPTKVLLQAIRRLERMVARARREDGTGPGPERAGREAAQSSENAGPETAGPETEGPETKGAEDRGPQDRDPQALRPRPRLPGPRPRPGSPGPV